MCLVFNTHTIDDSEIMFDEIVELTDVPRKWRKCWWNESKAKWIRN